MRAPRLLAHAGLLLALGVAPSAQANRVRDAAHATTELDVEGAARALEGVQTDSEAVAFERARLALYRGDCDTAEAILSAPSLTAAGEGAGLQAAAQGCARALAGALVVEDPARGVWVRLQDSRDRALVPFIVHVAAASRDYLSRELAIDLPRPLRIDLVRDLFSLAAVSGLPVEAAETTGTVGVARFGRVILVSPRATPRGYPWEDTLAHEIVHLFVTRASRDAAPLWLQEGIAKMYENGWRKPRPFDESPGHYDAIAREARRAGRGVGLEGLGQSIALLPTPELAATAYAEVTSFTRYWVEDRGSPALRLLLADLRGLGTKDPDVALRSVAGYDLAALNRLWQRHLDAEVAPTPAAPAAPVLQVKDVLGVHQVVRSARLADLLAARGHYAAAEASLAPALAASPREPSLRWRAARVRLGLGDEAGAREVLGTEADIERPNGPWFGLRGRLAASAEAQRLGVALDPLAEDVACQGWPTLAPPRSSGAASAPPPAPPPPRLPGAADWRELCRSAREIPRD